MIDVEAIEIATAAAAATEEEETQAEKQKQGKVKKPGSDEVNSTIKKPDNEKPTEKVVVQINKKVDRCKFR